jgi:hypothetical protein
VAETDKTLRLRFAIDELRRTYDHISNIYDQLRVKALAVIAGEVAITTFIFSGELSPYPKELYGKIFFFVAIGFLGVSFALLLWMISPLTWKIPVEMEEVEGDLDDRHSDLQHLLEYTKKDYIAKITYCNELVSKRARRFIWTIYSLSGGAIILLVLKYGGTQI